MKRLFTDEAAISAIENSNNRSIASILRQLCGNDCSGAGYKQINRIVNQYGLNTDHWLGCRHMIGKKAPNRKQLSEIMVLNGAKINSHDLKLRILRDGLKPHQCEKCRLKKWLCQPIPLDLHHVNGNRRDNRPHNVKLYCPNCHAQTPNYCGRAVALNRAVAQLAGGVSLKN